MASNNHRYICNIYGGKGPLVMKGKFQAGATQAIKRGEILELTADTASRWVPIDSDFDATTGLLAIANEEIRPGDRAGYYEIIVPRPGDIFEFDLATENDVVVGQGLYYSSSEALAESGTNVIAYACGQEHYPQCQGHLSEDNSPDRGETIRNTSKVRLMFREACSYYSKFAK